MQYAVKPRWSVKLIVVSGRKNIYSKKQVLEITIMLKEVRILAVLGEMIINLSLVPKSTLTDR